MTLHPMNQRRYIYHGDRLTDESFKSIPCQAILRPDGRCITSKKNTMLLRRESDGMPFIGLRRMLRKIPIEEPSRMPLPIEEPLVHVFNLIENIAHPLEVIIVHGQEYPKPLR